MIVAGRDRDVARFVAAHSRFFVAELLPYAAIGWERDGQLVAGVVFDNYVPPNIDMHIAGVGPWCAPRFFGECFRYPFEQLQVARVTSRTAADNTAALRFVRAIGFREEGRIREAIEGGLDLIILGMLKRECRWLGVGKSGRLSESVREQQYLSRYPAGPDLGGGDEAHQ